MNECGRPPQPVTLALLEPVPLAGSASDVTHLVASYGYMAVFVLVAAESLGLPLPGETALIVAASYAGQTHRLSVWGIFGAAASTTTIGDNIGFWIGVQGGFRLLHRWGPRLRL